MTVTRRIDASGLGAAGAGVALPPALVGAVAFEVGAPTLLRELAIAVGAAR